MVERDTIKAYQSDENENAKKHGFRVCAISFAVLFEAALSASLNGEGSTGGLG